MKRKKGGGIQKSQFCGEIVVTKSYSTLKDISNQMYKMQARKEIIPDILLLDWTGPSCTGVVQGWCYRCQRSWWVLRSLCFSCLHFGGIVQFILSFAPASSVAHATARGRVSCTGKQTKSCSCHQTLCLSRGAAHTGWKILYLEVKFGLTSVEISQKHNKKVKVIKLPVQTILLPLNQMLAWRCPKKGLLGHHIWHCLQTRYTVNHPMPFPDYCSPPHGSTSHGNGHWLGPGVDQQNGHQKCSPGESWSEPKACHLCWVGVLANGISIPEL